MNESYKIMLKLTPRLRKIKLYRWMSTSHSPEIQNETQVARYPPITDVVKTYPDKVKKRNDDRASKIQNLPTVEQKIVELNMPKYYGYYSVILKEEKMRIHCLDFLKFATRTEIYNNIPTHYYKEENKIVEEAVSKIKDPVEELISLHFGHQVLREFIHRFPKEEEDKTAAQNFLLDLNNVCMKYLSDYIPHLPSISVDFRPRIESFWFVGGFRPPVVQQKIMEGREKTKPFAKNPIDRAFRGSSQPALALRTNHGLPDVIPFDGNVKESLQVRTPSTSSDADVLEKLETEPQNDYSSASFNPLSCSPFSTDPKVWGLICHRKKAVIVPGFWPGLKDEHGHIFFHSREILEEKLRAHGKSFSSLLLKQNAVVSGFTQAQAYGLYQGFTPVNEMTYPIVQQSVSTNGKMFQFGLYQLNTSRLYGKYSTDNERLNYLWLSDDMPLFESVEEGKVKGFNEEVLRRLCLMYLKKGQPRENPAPYLADYKYLMHHDAPEEYREEFRKFHYNLMAERPENVKCCRPEILPWERIYKVVFKTRHFDRKAKFFENRWAENPYTRRLDDYHLEHIPRVRRLFYEIKRKPRIHSELLYKHDWCNLKRIDNLYDDHEIASKSMNIDPDTPPYFNGLLWRRGMNKFKPKV